MHTIPRFVLCSSLSLSSLVDPLACSTFFFLSLSSRCTTSRGLSLFLMAIFPQFVRRHPTRFETKKKERRGGFEEEKLCGHMKDWKSKYSDVFFFLPILSVRPQSSWQEPRQEQCSLRAFSSNKPARGSHRKEQLVSLHTRTHIHIDDTIRKRTKSNSVDDP